jgi:hypothetical protein
VCDDLLDVTARRISVAAVVRQLLHARSLQTPVESRRGIGYPHPFSNLEALILAVRGPWLEYPLLRDRTFGSGDDAGFVRVVYCRRLDLDDRYNVIYHNPYRMVVGADGRSMASPGFCVARRVDPRWSRSV